jgi:hypothetical protein
MGKIVGPITRGSGERSEPKSALKVKSEREQTVDHLMAYAHAKVFLRVDHSESARRKWREVLDIAGDEETAREVVHAAHREQANLCSPRYPVWDVHRIWFFTRYKWVKPEKPTFDQERVAYLLNQWNRKSERNVRKAREYIAVHGVSREDVLRIFGTDLYAILFPAEVSAERSETS